MKIKDIIGIDMSKLTFDACIYSNQVSKAFDNGKEGYKQLVDWAYKNSSFDKAHILFIFEHTGLYSHELSVYLESKNIPFLLVPGLEVKKSMGMVRGKNDKADAKMITRYGYRMRDEITPTKPSCEEVQSIKRLLNLRQRRSIHRFQLLLRAGTLDEAVYLVLHELIDFIRIRLNGVLLRLDEQHLLINHTFQEGRAESFI